jgi:hypothetical protein
MHARIRQYGASRFTPGELLQAGRQMLGAIALVPGFVSFVMLDAGDGRLTSVCICEETTALDAVDTLAATWLAEGVSVEPTPSGVTTGRIVLQRGL